MKTNWRFNLYSYEDRVRYAEYLSKEPYNKELDDLLVEFGRKERAMHRQDIRWISSLIIGKDAITDLSPEEKIVNDARRHFIRKCVDELPEKQKRRIVMHYWMGMTQGEIAKIEGIRQENVSRSIIAAQKNIMNKLLTFER